MKKFSNKQVFISLLIVAQVAVILFLFTYIKTKNNVIGVTAVNPLREDTLIQNEEAGLKYFYEPYPNQVIVEEKAPWLDSEVQYTINHDALNETKDYTITKKDGVFRIVTIGDSFTYGQYVNTSENWTELLEKKLNSEFVCFGYDSFEVINLGIPGFDIQYSSERYKIRGKKYDPDVVLWLLKDDDIYELGEVMREKQDQYIEEMKESGEYERLKEAGDPYPFTKKIVEDMQEYIDQVGLETLIDIQNKHLLTFQNSYQGKLVYVTFPSTNKRFRAFFRDQSFESDSIYYAEIRNIFDKVTPPWTFAPLDGHPNRLGHQIIEEDLYDYLTNSDIIPCDQSLETR